MICGFVSCFCKGFLLLHRHENGFCNTAKESRIPFIEKNLKARQKILPKSRNNTLRQKVLIRRDVYLVFLSLERFLIYRVLQNNFRLK